MENLTPFGFIEQMKGKYCDCEGKILPNQIIAECIFELET